MAKATTKLNAQDRVILFAARPASTTPGATGIDHAAAGILAHAMQSMATGASSRIIAESQTHRTASAGQKVWPRRS
jgi:hypothetical protein